MGKKNRAHSDLTEALCIVSEQLVLKTVIGELDQNLKLIEEKLGVRIGRAPEGLLISGPSCQVELAQDLLSQLSGLVQSGEQLFPGDIERAIKMLSANRNMRLADLFREQIKIAGRQHSIVPKTPNQKFYIDAIKKFDLIFAIGPAGTGKTYLAMAMAVAALLRKEVKRVILCRPAVEAGEKLGFLPGDMAEKVNPYLRPLYDALHDMVDFEKGKELVDRGVIEVAPLAFMRGRTLSNAFVILDEAQNTTPVQMKMFLTRLGLGAKCVVTGDITQIDLPAGVTSGLQDAIKKLDKVTLIGRVNFSEADVIRHPLVTEIVLAYQNSERKKR